MKRVGQFLPKVVGFPRVLWFPPTGKVDSVWVTGVDKMFFFLGTWVEGYKFYVKFAIYNYKNNYCIICTLVIIGFRLVLAYARTSQ